MQPDRRIVAVALCAVVSTAVTLCTPFGRGAPAGDAEKVDVFAINRMVRNRKVRQSYVDCFLDKGPCSPEAENIKRMVPDAIQNDCQHCTELQRRVIEKMMCYLEFHQPDIVKEIAAKFDPDGEFMRGYMDTILKNGNGHSLNPHLYPQQPQPNPSRPQSNPLPPQSNPLPPQLNPSQPAQPQPNPSRPQSNPLPPQSSPPLQPNPLPPQSNPLPPNPLPSQSNPLQPQPNPSRSQPNPSQPQPNPSQPQPNPSQSNQFQPPQNQPQQRITEVRTSPLEVF